MKKLFLFFFSFIFFSLTYGQGKYSFKHLEKKDGLSSNQVYCIFEDSHSFMWFGTVNGLNKYDGYDFEVFRQKKGDTTSIGNNDIVCIAENPLTHKIWVGTQKGLNCFDPSTNKFERVRIPGFPPKVQERINKIVFDDTGKLYLATGYGAYIYHIAEKRFENILTDSETIDRRHHYLTLLIDKDKNIWLGHSKHLVIFPNGNHLKKQNILTTDMWDLHQDNQGNVWVTTFASGIFLFGDGDWKKQPQHWTAENGKLPITNKRMHLTETDNNEIIIGIENWGALLFNLKDSSRTYIMADKYSARSISSKAIHSSYYSSSGILWFGTFNSGVSYWDSNSKSFGHIQMTFQNDGLFNNNVRSMHQDMEGNIWIGTKEEGGLSKYDPETQRFKNYKASDGLPKGPSNDFILSIEDIDKDHLLVGMLRTGFDIFDKRTETFTHVPLTLSARHYYSYRLHRDTDGDVWIGTGAGIAIYNHTTKSIRNIERCSSIETCDRIYSNR